MKIAFFSESPADQAALAVFAEGILGAPPEPINMDLQAHSLPAFFGALDGVFRGVHFNSDAEALVVVVDVDDTDLHALTHGKPDNPPGTCRLCKIKNIIDKTRQLIGPRPSQVPLKVAIGLAAPAIEAWYLVGKENQIGEAAILAAGRSPLSRPKLKQLVYGTDRPSLELETECAVREARRIIGGNLQDIETLFPAGFGQMAREIRSWSAT